jgi:small subunit ribosomal protein S17
MAENPDETPENIVEEVASAGDAGRGDERSEAEQSTPDEGTTEAEATSTQSRRERNAVARQAKAKAATGPRTLEERIAEREARREQTARSRRAYRAKQKAKRAAARAEAPAPAEPLTHEHGPGKPKVRQGIVISDKADKTIVVRIDVARRHKRYQKILRTSTTLHVHDERNDANAGDTVRVQECRPMSRTKRWRLTEILERAR